MLTAGRKSETMADHLTPQQKNLLNRRGAALAIFDAKREEHKAACMIGAPEAIRSARDAVQAACEALLDVEEMLLRTLRLN